MDKNKNIIQKIFPRLTESEWEQFKLGNLFVRCRTEENAKEFVYNCKLHDIKLVDENETSWEICRENTVYRVIKGFLSYCHVKYYNEHLSDNATIIEFNYNPTSIWTYVNKEDNNKAEKEEYMAANNSANMDFKQAMQTWDRMCSNFIDGCSNCPLFMIDSNKTCRDWVGEHPDEAVKIFVKWTAENPEKTIMDDFFEKHPKAPKDENGIPFACAQRCGYTEGCIGNTSRKYCTQCWRQPLEETEE